MTHDDVFLEAAQVIHLARVAASVRTRVVSWKDAALRKLSVSSEALVMPSSTGCASAGLPPIFSTRWFSSSNSILSICSPQRNVRVARFGDAHLAQHLADDDFDVLVVDRHALQAINFLHFVDQVLLQFLRAADVENFVRVNRAFGQLLAFLHEIALEDDDVLADRNEMFLFHAGLLDP